MSTSLSPEYVNVTLHSKRNFAGVITSRILKQIILDYPSECSVITKVFIRGRWEVRVRDVMIEVKDGVIWGQEPRNTGSLQKLEKTRKHSPFRASRRNIHLDLRFKRSTVDFSSPKLQDNKFMCFFFFKPPSLLQFVIASVGNYIPTILNQNSNMKNLLLLLKKKERERENEPQEDSSLFCLLSTSKLISNLDIQIIEYVSHSVVSDFLQPIDCRLPGSFVHGILQARILEWVAIPFSRQSSQPRD